MIHRFARIASALVLGLASAVMTASTPHPASNDGNISLTGTEWRLAATDGRSESAGFTLKATRSFDDGSSGVLVDASDGCNWLRGAYVQQGTELHIRVLAKTLLACPQSRVLIRSGDTTPPPAAPYGQHFSRALGDAAQFRLNGSTLELLDQHGKLLLRFTATAGN